MRVIVRNRDEILYEGEAISLSSVNDKGPFDVLPKHTNFISLISGYLDIRISDKQKKRIELDSGLIRVVSDNVEVYLGVKEALKNI